MAKSRLTRDLDHAIVFAQREQLFLQQNARGETREQRAIGLDVFQQR